MGQKGQFTGTKRFYLLVPIFSGYKTDYGVCAQLQFEFARFLSVREFVKFSKNILKMVLLPLRKKRVFQTRF